MIIIISHFKITYLYNTVQDNSHMYDNAALNVSSKSLEVTGTGNAFQTVAAACTKVQSPAFCSIRTRRSFPR